MGSTDLSDFDNYKKTVSILVHDMNNNLATVQLNVELIESSLEGAPQEDLSQSFALLSQSCLEIQRILKELSSLSQGELSKST